MCFEMRRGIVQRAEVVCPKSVFKKKTHSERGDSQPFPVIFVSVILHVCWDTLRKVHILDLVLFVQGRRVRQVDFKSMVKYFKDEERSFHLKDEAAELQEVTSKHFFAIKSNLVNS